MRDPTLEQAKDSAEAEHDVVGIEFCDPQQEVYGLLRIARLTSDGSASAVALLCIGSEKALELSLPAGAGRIDGWDSAEVGSARMTIEQPLQRWTAAVAEAGAGFAIELNALTEPLELAADDAVAALTGTREYEQLCEVTGQATVGGKKRDLRCTGRRIHIWGSSDWNTVGSRRSIHLVTDNGSGVAIMSGRPSGAAGHDADVSGARFVPADSDPVIPEQLRVSTVYDSNRLASSASLELWLGGEDQLARRASGEATCKAALTGNDREYRISFFRWSLDGRPAWGSYVITGPAQHE